MSSPKNILVIGPGGVHGTIDTATCPLDGSRGDVLVQLESGTPVLVPLTALVRQDDGSYRLDLDPAEFERRRRTGNTSNEPVLVMPVLQESLEVGTRLVETGRVRLHKVVNEREMSVDPPLMREEAVIERVPINRIVEAPISTRFEGETVIMPVLEEVLVVEKRLLLREEVRITKQRVETHTPQRVRLRREEAVVERVGPEGHEANPDREEHHHGEDSHRPV